MRRFHGRTSGSIRDTPKTRAERDGFLASGAHTASEASRSPAVSIKPLKRLEFQGFFLFSAKRVTSCFFVGIRMTQAVTSMARIKMPAARSKAQEITFEEAFHIFLTDSAARGLAEKTLKTYRNHLHCISLYFDISTPLGKLSRNKIHQIINLMQFKATSSCNCSRMSI